MNKIKKKINNNIHNKLKTIIYIIKIYMIIIQLIIIKYLKICDALIITTINLTKEYHCNC